MTNAEAWFNKSLRPRKPEGSLGRTAQDCHSTLTQLLNFVDSVITRASLIVFMVSGRKARLEEKCQPQRSEIV